MDRQRRESGSKTKVVWIMCGNFRWQQTEGDVISVCVSSLCGHKRVDVLVQLVLLLDVSSLMKV